MVTDLWSSQNFGSKRRFFMRMWAAFKFCLKRCARIINYFSLICRPSAKINTSLWLREKFGFYRCLSRIVWAEISNAFCSHLTTSREIIDRFVNLRKFRFGQVFFWKDFYNFQILSKTDGCARNKNSFLPHLSIYRKNGDGFEILTKFCSKQGGFS